MLHGMVGNKLNRNRSLRRATLRDLAKSTLIRQRICTTRAKAKEARRLVEQLITLGKSGTLANKRRAFAILCDHGLVSDLFGDVAPRFKNRVGGYTRIIPLAANRRGDNAQMVYLELTEKNEALLKKNEAKAATNTQDIDVKAKPSEPKVVKEKSHKEDSSQPHASHDPESLKKGTSIKKSVGGLKKMFMRKTPDGK